MTSTSDMIPLREWIRNAVEFSSRNNSSGGFSSAFLKASLQIAVSLADQISQAEELARYNFYDGVEMLPSCTGSEWAACVTVQLKKRDDFDQATESQAEAADVKANTQASIGNFHHQRRFTDDLNAVEGEDELEEFLNTYDVDYFERVQATTSAKVDSFITDALKGRTSFSNTATSRTEDLNYLGVDSAEIRRSGSESANFMRCKSNLEKDGLRRIYSLGLVIYELFSGGEAPPPELRTIISSDGAFISLPKLTLAEKTGTDHNAYSNESKRHHGPSGSAQEIGLCQLSFEYLKLMGLPGNLCSLIFNMLDCVYGDFSTDECYTKMADVVFDLQLMIDKPHSYLQNLDLEKLSQTGLQMDEAVLSRDKEFATIQSSYKRCISGSSEMAVIVGTSGTGKSCLADRVGRFVSSQGGFFLACKFDQMKQARPFSALASAFNQYCDVLTSHKDSDWAQVVAGKLWSALGEDAIHLIKIIPNLGRIVPCNINSSTKSFHDQNCQHSLQRLHHLLCQFVDIICEYSLVCVMLFIDDGQWIDEASVSVLHRLLLKRHKKFFFLGCCREMEDDNLFQNMIRDIHAFGNHVTTVKLNCMDKDTLNQLVSEALSLPPRIVKSLSDIIYSKTKGNPLFFNQLMLSLNRDGLLHLSLSKQRWEWDEEKIQAMALPDNVATCFTQSISKLPLEVKLAIHTLSCFGASAKCEYLEVLESQRGLKLIDPLKAAADEGLVCKMKSSFHFCHDRIQETSYNMILEGERRQNHMKYARSLVKSSLETGNDDFLFTAVHQMNLAGPSAASDTDELVLLAKFNLTAGKKSMEVSDFPSSCSFFSHAMHFLPDSYWTNHYQLSLELFEMASKSAIATGNISSLRLFSEEVLKHARCFDDKLNIYFICMPTLGYQLKMHDALKKGLKVLSWLGEDLPSNPSGEDLSKHVKRTQSMLRGITEENLLNYRIMIDSNKLLAMKFLAKLESAAFMISPDLHPFVTLKMVQLTISHGLSNMAPVGFVYFGSLLATLGDLRVGHRFTLLARDLVKKMNAKEVVGETIGVGSELQTYMEPYQSANEWRKKCETAALAVGDIQNASMARLRYCTMLFWSGVALSNCRQAFSEAVKTAKQRQHKTSLLFLLSMLNIILTLIGAEDEALSGSELLRMAQESPNPRHLMTLSLYNLYLSFMFNNDDAMKEWIEKLISLERKSWFLLADDAAKTLIVGLSSFRLYRQTRSSVWMERGIKCKEEMMIWDERGCSWNFQQKAALLFAEEQFCKGNYDSAQEAYQNAVTSARSHKFINDEALACELAAYFFLEIGDLSSVLEHFSTAHEKYHKWGAIKKANDLFQFTKERLSVILSDKSPSPLTNYGITNLQ